MVKHSSIAAYPALRNSNAAQDSPGLATEVAMHFCKAVSADLVPTAITNELLPNVLCAFAVPEGVLTCFLCLTGEHRTGAACCASQNRCTHFYDHPHEAAPSGSVDLQHPPFTTKYPRSMTKHPKKGFVPPTLSLLRSIHVWLVRSRDESSKA